MNKLLPTIADMPEADREIVDYLLTDLAQLAREKFAQQLQGITDTELRHSLIVLMEHGFFKVEVEENYVQWMMYQPSSDSWIKLPTSRAYQERRKL